MKSLNFKTEARRCEAAALSRFSSSSSKLPMPISETIGIGMERDAGARGIGSAAPKIHPHPPDMKIPKAFHDSHAYWRGFWYCKSARGRSPMDAERAASGFKWNWYMHHRKTTPMHIPSWLFDHHKHSSLNSMHGSSGSRHGASNWSWSARHDDESQARMCISNIFESKSGGLRNPAEGRAQGLESVNHHGSGTAYDRITAGSARGFAKAIDGSGAPIKKISHRGSGSLESGRDDGTRVFSIQSIPPAPAQGDRSYDMGLDGRPYFHASSCRQAMPLDSAGFGGPRSASHDGAISSVWKRGSSDIATGTAIAGRSFSGKHQSGSIADAAAMAGLGSVLYMERSGGEKRSARIDHPKARRSKAIAQVSGIQIGDHAKGAAAGFQNHDRNEVVAGAYPQGRSSDSLRRAGISGRGSPVSNAFARKIIQLKVAVDAAMPE